MGGTERTTTSPSLDHNLLDPGPWSNLIVAAMNRVKHMLGLALIVVAFLGQGIAAAADQAGCCAPEMQAAMQEAQMAGMDMPCHSDVMDDAGDVKADNCCKDMASGPVMADLGSIEALATFTENQPRSFEAVTAEGRTPDYIPPPPNA